MTPTASNCVPSSSTFSTSWALASLCGLALFSSASTNGLAQGCVATRGAGLCSIHGAAEGGIPASGDWQASVGYRWLHSDRHFVGDREQKQRQQLGNEVINDSHFIDASISYNFTPRYSTTLVLPFVYSDRSSLYEHDRVNRHHSQAGGLGDLRLTGYAWLWDPASKPNGNVQVGVGLKAPTGDYKATDTFISAKGPVKGWVDQSIQPGDGGWGFTVEANGWRKLFDRTFAYAQGYYLFNPQDQNGTPTTTGAFTRGNPYEQICSIPDQYMGRAGVSYVLLPSWGLQLSLGGRIEGVPVEDFIGDSNGFRRPGFSVGIEPGISFMKNKWTVSLTTPVALYRNRETSVADKRLSADTGIARHGDAAFADYVITFTVARQF